MAKLNVFYGLCIANGEKEKLRKLCIKHQIPILYPELFENENEYHLWGINQDGIGLIGTIIMQNLAKEKIFHSLSELEDFLNK